MELLDVFDFRLWGVFDRGVPNKERIVLHNRAEMSINTASYGLLVGLRHENLTTPLPNRFLWLGEAEIDPGTWMVVYTGPGTARVSQHPNTKEPVVITHWGSKTTMFEDQRLVPILFEIGQATIAKSPDWLFPDSPTAVEQKSLTAAKR